MTKQHHQATRRRMNLSEFMNARDSRQKTWHPAKETGSLIFAPQTQRRKRKNKTQAKLFNLKVNLLAVRSEIVLMPMIQFPPEQGLTELITT